VINTTRSADPPASLAACKQYSGSDVIEALLRDFRGKCYLCESPISSRDHSVDHRRSQALFPELKFTWTNLFPACRDCNERRPKPRERYQSERLLDPTCDDVEARLLQTLRYDDPQKTELPCFVAQDPADVYAMATAYELNYLHNSGSVKAAELRDAIRQRVDEVLERLLDFQHHGLDTRGPVRAAWEEPLRADFSRRSPFTALLRGRLGAGVEHLFD